MTCGELIKKLKLFSGKTKVYISSDSEGNSYGSIDTSSIEEDHGNVIIYPYIEALDIMDLDQP